MKRLFDDDEKLTEYGKQLSAQVFRALNPIMQHFLQSGYSTIEIEKVIHDAYTIELAASRIHRAFHKRSEN